MLSFKLASQLRYWVNIAVVENKVYRIKFSSHPLGGVGENRYTVMIRKLVEGGLRWWEVPHYPPGGLEGEVLRFLASKVGRGQVTSYKSLGLALGLHPRKVAAIMRRNRLPIIYPCHRVVHADGRIGGYFSRDLKVWLLRVEGVEIVDGRVPSSYFVEL